MKFFLCANALSSIYVTLDIPSIQNKSQIKDHFFNDKKVKDILLEPGFSIKVENYTWNQGVNEPHWHCETIDPQHYRKAINWTWHSLADRPQAPSEGYYFENLIAILKTLER